MHIITIFIIIAIALFGDFHNAIDISLLHQKKIDFWYVYSSNLKLLSLMSITGIVTLCISSLYTYFINIISLGTIANCVILNGFANLTVKLIPHGLIELFVLNIALMQSIFLHIYFIKDIKKVIFKKISLKNISYKYFSFIIINELAIIVFIFIAAIAEYGVSHIQV